MGSAITLSAYSDSEAEVAQAFNAVQLEIDRLVAILSDYEPNSELNRLHREATTPQRVSNELYEVLLASEQWYTRSNGAFDAAIGNLTRLWREARKRREVPSEQEVEEAVLQSGWNKVHLNQNDRTLMLRDPKVRIDLGGIAAGYIVDRAFDILLAHGLSHALVNDGGDIRVGEPPPGREGWRIEVASLSSRSSQKSPPLRRIYLRNAAITTSGDLWQFIEIDGQRRSHILDPKTGYGVVGPTMVTVIAPTCIEADVAATAVSVLGCERGFALISELPNLKALYASRLSDDSSIAVQTTEGFPEAIPDGNPPTK
jgi:thiamine biosynthesis lipoprotein